MRRQKLQMMHLSYEEKNISDAVAYAILKIIFDLTLITSKETVEFWVQ